MKHTYTIRIPSFLCRPDDRVGYDGMASLFQEAAWEHAQRFGVDFTESESNLYWVLHRLGIRFYRPPKWTEEITITTWPSRIVRLSAMREFEVRTKEGDLVVDASSAWLVMSDSSPRPVKPERLLSAEWTEESWRFDLPMSRTEEIADPTRLTSDAEWHAVRQSDTDRNAHVNNARYLQWMSDWAPRTVGIERSGTLSGVFSFTNETRRGQLFTVISDGEIAEVWVRDRDTSPAEAVCACRYTPGPSIETSAPDRTG